MFDFPRDPLQWGSRANLPQAQHFVLSIDLSQATLAGAPGKELRTLSLKAVVVSHHTQGQGPQHTRGLCSAGCHSRETVPVTRPGAAQNGWDCFRNELAANERALCDPRGLSSEQAQAVPGMGESREAAKPGDVPLLVAEAWQAAPVSPCPRGKVA